MKKFLIFIFVFVTVNIFALQVPKLKGRINDYANILSSREEAELEKMLLQTEKQTSAEFVLLTVRSLEGESIESFSMDVAEKWKIGKNNRDNGVIVLVSMKERKIRIEVGYGLESIITDLKSGYIIRNYLAPQFKKGNYFLGIKSSFDVITGIVSNEYDISPKELTEYQKKQKKSKKESIPIGFIIFALFIIFGSKRRGRGGLLPLLFLSSALGGSNRSSGGFGGFSGGGGSFGGGGASGGW